MSTVVALHAHPDDESLLTGGTLARLAAEGHRVVLIVATSGSRGLTDPHTPVGDTLGAVRQAEVERAAAVLGCARVVHLGYADSGWDGTTTAAHADGFAAAPLTPIVEAVAAVLRVERADVLIGYDRFGGYGHPDHRRVHEVAVEAARLAGTPRLLAATIDRAWICRGLAVLAALRLVPPGTATDQAARWFSSRAEITHRVSVGRYASRKRRALACHRSQRRGGSGPRTVSILVGLPPPLFRLVAGVEWFVELDAHRVARPLTDLLAAAPR